MKLTLSLMALLCVIGCTRTEYRESADQQAYQILKEKSQDPRWRIPKMDITPDPASRFYDVHDLVFSAPLSHDFAVAHPCPRLNLTFAGMVCDPHQEPDWMEVIDTAIPIVTLFQQTHFCGDVFR